MAWRDCVLVSRDTTCGGVCQRDGCLLAVSSTIYFVGRPWTAQFGSVAVAVASRAAKFVARGRRGRRACSRELLVCRHRSSSNEQWETAGHVCLATCVCVCVLTGYTRTRHANMARHACVCYGSTGRGTRTGH
eukprot:2445824-Prymnesium_polylepis.1